MTLLADELMPQGHVILDIGSDHWFRDPEIDTKALTLTQLMLDLIEQ